MASIPVVVRPTVGLDITTPPTAAAASQTFDNDGNVRLVVHNGNAGIVTATIVVQQKYFADGRVGGAAIPNIVQAIPIGAYWEFGRLDPNTFNDVNAQVTVTFDVFSSVTLKAIRH